MKKKMIHFRGNATGFFNYIGCGLFLRHHYNLNEVKFSGCSSGSIISAIMALDIDFTEAVIIPFQLQPKSNNQLALMGNWKKKLKRYLGDIIPSDEDYAQFERLRVGVQFMDGFQFFNSFHSKEDLINCLLASTHIPFFMDFKPFDKFRGRLCMDGDILSRYERLNETEAFYLSFDVSFKKGVSLKTEKELIQLIKNGYQTAMNNRELNNYLKPLQMNPFDNKYLFDFFEELKIFFVEEYTMELQNYISK